MTELFSGDSFAFSFIVLPLLIFLSRIADQSIGTIRIIFVSKGMKYWAPLLGFFEVLLWLIIMRQIFQNLNNPVYYIAYAAGFGMGNYVGILIEEKMAMGLSIIRVIPQKDSSTLTGYLREADFRFTSISGVGAEGPVDIIFSVIKRKDIAEFTSLVKKFNPNAFYTIEEVKFVSGTKAANQYPRNDGPGMKNLYKLISKRK